MQDRSLEYQLRAARHRLLGAQLDLKTTFSFAGLRDRYDAQNDVTRLERAVKQEQRETRERAWQTLLPEQRESATHPQQETA